MRHLHEIKIDRPMTILSRWISSRLVCINILISALILPLSLQSVIKLCFSQKIIHDVYSWCCFFSGSWDPQNWSTGVNTNHRRVPDRIAWLWLVRDVSGGYCRSRGGVALLRPYVQPWGMRMQPDKVQRLSRVIWSLQSRFYTERQVIGTWPF